jgi:hypothetical protein
VRTRPRAPVPSATGARDDGVNERTVVAGRPAAAPSARSGYELRVVCANSAEFEAVIDVLKRDHGVRELRSRLLLREVPLGPAGLLGLPNRSQAE